MVVVRDSAAMLLGGSSVGLVRLVRLLLVFEYQMARYARRGYRTVRHARCDSVLNAIPLCCRREGRFA